MEDGSINISQSKVKSWRQCRRQYHNKYALGLSKKKVKRPFMFGTIVHHMAEADFKGKDPLKVLNKIELDNKKMFRREIEMYGNIIEDIRDIMIDYFDYWEGEVKPIKGPDGSLAEHEFRIELDKQLWFTGKMDAIVKAKKMRWLMEHKTFNRLPGEDDRWRSVQGASYFKAAEQIGFGTLDGVLWDYVSSKPPAIPTTILKDGSFSQAKINSIPSRILRFIKENDLKKKDYAKLLADVKENRRNYFIRIYSPVKPRIVDNIWNDFVITAKEIQEHHGKRTEQNIGRHCSWCDYQILCKTEAVGSDVDWVIAREYTRESDQGITTDGDDRSED